MNANNFYEIIWQFEIHAAQRSVFEMAYGAMGDWAQLFARASGFLETRLLTDDDRPNVYVTVDRWLTRAHFEEFKVLFADAYAALDRKLAPLTQDERRIRAYRCSGIVENSNL